MKKIFSHSVVRSFGRKGRRCRVGYVCATGAIVRRLGRIVCRLQYACRLGSAFLSPRAETKSALFLVAGQFNFSYMFSCSQTSTIITLWSMEIKI